MDKGFFNYSLLLILLFTMLIFMKTPPLMQHAHEVNQLELKHIEEENNKAFEYLMNSGRKRFIGGAYKSAYSEFKLAYDIKPNNEEVKSLIHEILVLLCQDDKHYCKELDDLKL